MRPGWKKTSAVTSIAAPQGTKRGLEGLVPEFCYAQVERGMPIVSVRDVFEGMKEYLNLPCPVPAVLLDPRAYPERP